MYVIHDWELISIVEGPPCVFRWVFRDSTGRACLLANNPRVFAHLRGYIGCRRRFLAPFFRRLQAEVVAFALVGERRRLEVPHGRRPLSEFARGRYFPGRMFSVVLLGRPKVPELQRQANFFGGFRDLPSSRPDGKYFLARSCVVLISSVVSYSRLGAKPCGKGEFSLRVGE